MTFTPQVVDTFSEKEKHLTVNRTKDQLLLSHILDYARIDYAHRMKSRGNEPNSYSQAMQINYRKRLVFIQPGIRL